MSRRPVILGATVVAAALLASLAAATEARASHQGTPHKLVVRTIPTFKGVPVKLNKKKKNTGRRGLAILTHSSDKKLKKRLTVADAQPAEHVRSRFARWYGDPNRQNVSKLTAALDVDYLVGFNFIDRDGEPIDAAEISRMVLRSSVGNILEFEGEALQSQHWLHGTRVVSRREGPFAKEILYSVEQVIVNGSNVVNRAQQRFVPEEARDFAITLLYFTATFTATDALFGHTTGSGIRLERPDGVVEEHAFNDGGTLVLAGLPRGEYIVSVIGPGPAFERPVTVTRDQDVELDVLSWLDLGITALVLAIARHRPAVDRTTAFAPASQRGSSASAAPTRSCRRRNAPGWRHRALSVCRAGRGSKRGSQTGRPGHGARDDDALSDPRLLLHLVQPHVVVTRQERLPDPRSLLERRGARHASARALGEGRGY